MEPYSSEDDLLVGDMLISARTPKEKFIVDAMEEMNAKLGYIYKLPLTPLVGTELPIHERLLLKSINNKMASGRLIMTLDIAGEGSTLHAYGARLVAEANRELLLLANGTVELSAELLVESDMEYGSRSPSIQNIDETSGVEAFYQWATPPPHPILGRPVWQPGSR